MSRLSFGRIAATFRTDVRIMMSDPIPPLLLIAMPVAIVAFVSPGVRYALQNQGFGQASGAEQAIPGLAVLFSSMAVSFVAFAFFREHGWKTWPRLRAGSGSDLELILGKCGPAGLLIVLQLSSIFAIGALVFHLKFVGPILALFLVIVAFASFLVAFALLLVAVCRSVQQCNALANLVGLAWAGLGGALSPASLLPPWARLVAPFTPSYWAMQGFRSVTLGEGGPGAGYVAALVLALAAAAVLALALARFRSGDRKQSWA